MHIFKKAIAVLALTATAGIAQAQEKVSIAHSTESFAFLPFFTAVAMGTFEEAGVDLEVIRTGSGSKTVAAVIGGSADIGIGSATGVLYSRKQGLDNVMIGAVLTQYSSSIVYSKDWAEEHNLTADSSHEDMLAAMKGIKIGTSGPGGGDHIIRYFAEEAGLDPDRDMTIVYLGSDIGVYQASLQQGQIDGIALSAPTPQIAIRDQGAIFAFNTGAGKVASLDGYLYIVASAKRDWIEDHPEALAKVQEALQMALDILHDPEQSDIARQRVHDAYYAQTEESLFNAIWAEAVAGMPESTQITQEQVDRVVAFTNTFEKENPIDDATVEGAFLQ
ncbi:ABC transporter substrate-binding protein [Salipiger abyssi]|uniref:ABC transporter substrate-binding protein n=1 Tax=Salipiger abyssi TaxID=1250539 RepID=UPI001A8BF469|nr:ABC transporter substrate-binding protein [Salipiger abyssi]MBN9889293.1 ABC transporter substrate-binding protein [Salipiger abyssi]